MIEKLRNRKGSVLVEFALVAPLLVLILVGIMVMGVLINAKLVVASAAREAGRSYSILKDEGLARSKATDAMVGGGLKMAAGGQMLYDPARDVSFDRQGDYVTVTVRYLQPTIVPLVGELMGGSNGTVLIRSVATFRVERAVKS